jgi:hypothetical protein
MSTTLSYLSKHKVYSKHQNVTVAPILNVVG